MIWEFSDGTTVALGGIIEGASVFAQRLRSDLRRGVKVSIWPPPGGTVPLDVNDAALVDTWLGDELRWRQNARKLDLSMTKRPDGIPALPPPPWDSSNDEPGLIY
jgi:hypothetical protein